VNRVVSVWAAELRGALAHGLEPHLLLVSPYDFGLWARGVGAMTAGDEPRFAGVLLRTSPFVDDGQARALCDHATAPLRG
jgi:hypothetical protein